MPKSKLQIRAGKTTGILLFPLILSLIPALVADDIFRFRIASLPIGYIIMIVFTVYLALKTQSHRISVKKYLILMFLTCLLAVFPIQITTAPIQHLAAAILIVYNIYLFWLGINLGSKADHLLVLDTYKRLWQLILFCLFSYFFLERLIETTSFPNILPFFFYRGAEGGFLISLLSITVFEIVRGRRSQSLKITIVLLLIAIVFLESRTTYIAAFLVISFSLLNSLRGFAVFLLGIFLLLALLNFMPDISERIQRVSEASRLFSLDLDLARTDGASMYRIIFWSGSIEIIKEYWLTGIGFSVKDINDRFPIDLLMLKETVPRPHNTFLSIFMGSGFIGVLTYFSILLGPAIALIRDTKLFRKGGHLGRNVIIGYFIGFAALMLTNDIETNPQFLIIFGFTIGYFKCNYSLR
ncbi:O-antigen ligase family protein [Amylibacter sp.]|nr:O-antigen ligase family protein [Amylibacter sp.]